MNSEVARELRVELARTGLKQRDVARRMGYKQPLFSKILRNKATMPENFRAEFLVALREEGEAEAARLRADGEEAARRLIDSLSAPPESMAA